jgi:hypothetical protein
VRQQVGKDLMNEADEEHHVPRVLIAELDASDREKNHRDAKVKGPRRKRAASLQGRRKRGFAEGQRPEYRLRALGKQILDRKDELQEDGIPLDAEHALLRKTYGRAETPAAASRSRKSRKATT